MSFTFTFCPRCGERTLQNLKTHSFCIECNYSPTLDGQENEPLIPDWALAALRNGGSDPTAEETLENLKIVRIPLSGVANVKGA